jgi:hypothetical protein
MATVATQGLKMHVAEVSTPSKQLVEPLKVYPTLQVGVQDALCARYDPQVPTIPFAGGVDASHEFGTQVADEKTPSLQKEVPLSVYPLLQVGTQVAPSASLALQFPISAFEGGVLPSQPTEIQLAGVKTPNWQEPTPELL